MNINLQGKTFGEIVEAIKHKKNTDYCGIYELMYHEKMKKDCFKTVTIEEELLRKPRFR